MPDTIHILLGDPNEHFQNSLESVIRKEKCILMGNASHAKELQQLACAQKPDVIIIDVHPPALIGFDTIAYLTKHHQGIAVIAFSFWHQPQQIQRAIDAGAAGIICKNSPCDNVMKAVRAVHAGMEYHCKKVQKDLEDWRHLQRHIKSVIHEELDEKERLALQSFIEGMTNAQVAERTGLKARSMEDVKARIRKKIGGNNFIQCIVKSLYYEVASFPEGVKN